MESQLFVLTPYLIQSHAKTQSEEVGKHSIQLVINLLKENGEPDEYLEALELIARLVKPKGGVAGSSNSALILRDVSNVELLLDLLEHEETLVGVMASEILTSMHSINSEGLEKTIQECPAGMTKLLHCMPERSREEVSNEAIMLVRQLTSTNEEIKKTVAFNEVASSIYLIYIF
jgi:hypothetical protein